MATGPIILAFFAAIWAIVGTIAVSARWYVASLAVIPSICIVFAAARLARTLPPRGEAEDRRIGRLVGIWTGIEGIAIPIGIALAANLGHPRAGAAVMCLIVGLHFFPLARGIPRRSLYAPAILLTLIGAAGLAFDRVVPAAYIDLAAAAGLWLAATMGLADMRRTGGDQTKL